MDDKVLFEIVNCLKILKSNNINIPNNKEQGYTNFTRFDNKDEIYKLIINRKGRIRENPLSYSFFSDKLGVMIRLDMTGSPHEDKDGNSLDTPHVHIFDDSHNNGKIVEPLSYLTNQAIINELTDSLIAILLHCNVDITNIQIPII